MLYAIRANKEMRERMRRNEQEDHWVNINAVMFVDISRRSLFSSLEDAAVFTRTATEEVVEVEEC